MIPKGMAGAARALVSAALVLMAGCAELSQDVTPVSGPSGNAGWLQVRCPNGGVRRCRELASKACPRGYEVADRRWDGAAYTSVSGLDDAAGAPGDDGSMIVACK
jgi:hypothetical protein